jgi:hypothetical protein
MFLMRQHRSKVAVLGACWERAWQTELIRCSIKPSCEFQDRERERFSSELACDLNRGVGIGTPPTYDAGRGATIHQLRHLNVQRCLE